MPPSTFCHNQGTATQVSIGGGEGVAVLLSLGVVFELVGHFVRPYPFLRFLLRVLSVAGVIAGALALALLIWGKDPTGADLAFEWIILQERSARFLQVCLLIVAIAMMSRLGLTWHHYSLESQQVSVCIRPWT